MNQEDLVRRLFRSFGAQPAHSVDVNLAGRVRSQLLYLHRRHTHTTPTMPPRRHPAGRHVIAARAGRRRAGAYSGVEHQPSEGLTMELNDSSRAAVKPGGTYVHAVKNTPLNWNLLSAAGNVLETGMVLQLITPSPYVAFPDLKHHWNEDLFVSEPELVATDPQTIVYRLRPEACWNDGMPVGVEDFRYTWRVSSGNHSPACLPSTHAGYELVESVDDADDGRTVVVTLASGKAFPDWDAMFSYLYPAHVAARAGDLGTADGLAAAFGSFELAVPTWSAGPYQVEHVEPGVEVVLVPNPHWYGLVAPSLDRVVFRVVTDPVALVDAVRQRAVHGMSTPQPTKALVDAFRDMSGIRYELRQGLVWEHLDLNTRNPFLADAVLRRAILTAIDRDEILTETVGTFHPDAQPLNSHNFLPGQPAYRDVITDTGQGSGDIAVAERLLHAAGYTIRDGRLHTADGPAVAALRFRHAPGDVMRRRTGELVRDQLRRIGLEVRVEPTDGPGTMMAGDYEIVSFNWIGNPVRVGPARDMWTTGGGMNYGHFSNAEVDRLISEANETLDLIKAHELLNRADEILSHEAYSLPLSQKPSLLAVDDRFANVRANPTNGLVIYNAQEWGLRV
ncbi:ABC transporter family substrate-binding protein [Streptomyces sp. NPDC088348]|uniref:ABC transporter family substrate-binding protein n=1 Tax=Streptomyces sp. NPDC088348 TaxID=3365853 RepID=UPI0037F70181